MVSRCEDRAVHRLEHGHGDARRRAPLDRVLQRNGRHVSPLAKSCAQKIETDHSSQILCEPAPKEHRTRRAARGQVLGARKRGLGRVAGRTTDRLGVRDQGAPMGARHPTRRPQRRPYRMRGDGHQPLGWRGPGRAGRQGRDAQHPLVYRLRAPRSDADGARVWEDCVWARCGGVLYRSLQRADQQSGQYSHSQHSEVLTGSMHSGSRGT